MLDNFEVASGTAQGTLPIDYINIINQVKYYDQVCVAGKGYSDHCKNANIETMPILNKIIGLSEDQQYITVQTGLTWA